ncbi:hypothetical protein LTR78_006527 [Recurvomyces mirabilis]|uniref:Uncharacterized protein n=1 Tax=Recurvomyces mirabilis TaxID=574656 RepID=A0AAE0WKX9_9PEZI|nr:hypothetical protein LTR78_006527 [Recurvomyces mirabilis]KAK5151055.1 hypothetical protein LTS14_009550 [Recurvomyces mirabilis]
MTGPTTPQILRDTLGPMPGSFTALFAVWRWVHFPVLFLLAVIICLRSEDVNDSLRLAIANNVAEAAEANAVGNNTMTYYYLSWVPGIDGPSRAQLPFQITGVGSGRTYTLRAGYLGPFPENPSETGPPASLFIAALPHQGNSGAEMAKDATIMQCTLWNMTYNTTYSYADAVQNITATIDASTGSPVSPEESFTLNATNAHDYQSDFQRLSFQSILDTLTYFINGAISFQAGNASQLTYWSGNKSLIAMDSGIVRMVLLDTPELSFLKSNASPALT